MGLGDGAADPETLTYHNCGHAPPKRKVLRRAKDGYRDSRNRLLCRMITSGSEHYGRTARC